jgi:hypothetical protein
MRTTRIIILLLLSISSYGQSGLINQREKDRREIAKRITPKKHDEVIMLAKVKGKDELQVDLNLNQDSVEISYNILKNKKGQIVYVGEFPTSEHDDWRYGSKHYFADNGKLIAFEKVLVFSNKDCSDKEIVENIIELYDNNFNVIRTTKKQTNIGGKKLKFKDCRHAYTWKPDIRATVTELIKLKKIRV